MQPSLTIALSTAPLSFDHFGNCRIVSTASSLLYFVPFEGSITPWAFNALIDACFLPAGNCWPHFWCLHWCHCWHFLNPSLLEVLWFYRWCCVWWLLWSSRACYLLWWWMHDIWSTIWSCYCIILFCVASYTCRYVTPLPGINRDGSNICR